MSIICLSFTLIAWNEMLWSACSEPTMRPVSCCGKKPLGTTTNKYMFRPIVAMKINSTSKLWRSAQVSVCP